ncbi:MAG: glycosyltransferase [Methylococcaceae bacterium]|jgi:glycosyltransferase involved in cell wall biosynthesis
MKKITIAVCSYNRAERLPKLIRALRNQQCSLPFEILIVENNCTDNSHAVLLELQQEPGAPLNLINEPKQGISHARNRAVEECLACDYMLFMDDDELPSTNLVQSAIDTFDTTDAYCVGGKVEVDFSALARPDWLEDNLLGFLAQVDHGTDLFKISSISTPVWTANIAYDMRIFRDNPDLRYDLRYNRAGQGVGGGEDVLMFEELLTRKIPTYYQPKMVVLHAVDAWKLKRWYFIKLHFVSGKKYGQYEIPHLKGAFFGVPAFMLAHFIRHCALAVTMLIKQQPGRIRQTMNAAHSLGSIIGKFLASQA